MDGKPRLIIFTRALCHECQTLKEAMGARDCLTRHFMEGAVIYTLPSNNVPRTNKEIDALSELDFWVDGPVVLPIGIDTASDTVLHGEHEILAFWKGGIGG